MTMTMIRGSILYKKTTLCNCSFVNVVPPHKRLWFNPNKQESLEDAQAWNYNQTTKRQSKLFEMLARVAKCHRYGRYICVKILEGWGKKCRRPHTFVKWGSLGINPTNFYEVLSLTQLYFLVSLCQAPGSTNDTIRHFLSRARWQICRLLKTHNPKVCSLYLTKSLRFCFVHSLVARKCLLDDVFINRICNEMFGTPSEGITLITLLNRYSTTLRRDFNDVLTMQSSTFQMKYSTTLRRDLSLLSVVE